MLSKELEEVQKKMNALTEESNKQFGKLMELWQQMDSTEAELGNINMQIALATNPVTKKALQAKQAIVVKLIQKQKQLCEQIEKKIELNREKMESLFSQYTKSASDELDKIIKKQKELLNAKRPGKELSSIEDLRSDRKLLAEEHLRLMNKKMETVQFQEKLRKRIEDIEKKYAKQPDVLKEKKAKEEEKIALLDKALKAVDARIEEIQKQTDAMLDEMSARVKRMYEESLKRDAELDEAFKKALSGRKQ